MKINLNISSQAHLFVVLLLILSSISTVAYAKLYDLDRNEKVVQIWTKSMQEISAATKANNTTSIQQDIQKLESLRGNFFGMPKNHLLRELGIAVINIRKMNLLYIERLNHGNSQYITTEMTRAAKGATPIVVLTQNFTPEKWDNLLKIFPELSEFAEYLNSFYAIAGQLYYNNLRSERDLEQVMSAFFSAAYLVPAARMDETKYSLKSILDAIKQVRRESPIKLDDEYYAVKYSYIAYALLYNKSPCKNVMSILREPKRIIEKKIKNNSTLSPILKTTNGIVTAAERYCKNK